VVADVGLEEWMSMYSYYWVRLAGYNNWSLAFEVTSVRKGPTKF
jgi:hypothetical protein